ncbi:MAG: penicillin-binding protein 1C, partial [Ferruginibacter sp.]
FDIFRLLPNVKWFRRPEYNYTYVPVCRQTGFRANIDCPDIDTLFMPPNAGRSPLCPYHKIIHLDPKGDFQVTEDCENPVNMIHKSWFILPPTMEYYYKQHNHDYISLPPFMGNCNGSASGRQMEIIYPQVDAKIYVPLEINGERGRSIFSATHKQKNVKIFWSLDDTFIQSTQGIHQIGISPSTGKHLLTLTDEKGISVSRSFQIIEKEK